MQHVELLTLKSHFRPSGTFKIFTFIMLQNKPIYYMTYKLKQCINEYHRLLQKNTGAGVQQPWSGQKNPDALSIGKWLEVK